MGRRVAMMALGVLLLAGLARAQSEVKVSGDARVDADVCSQKSYTGCNAGGTKQDAATSLWQRYRVQSDFVGDENFKLRVGVKVNNGFGGQQH